MRRRLAPASRQSNGTNTQFDKEELFPICLTDASKGIKEAYNLENNPRMQKPGFKEKIGDVIIGKCRDALNRIRELRPEAVIICGGRIDLTKPDQKFIALLRQTLGYTRIVVGSRSPMPEIPGIFVDHRASVDIGVRYLAGLGHREIGFVYSGKEYYGTAERLEEFRKVMKELGLPARREYLIGVSDYTVKAGLEGAEALLKLRRIPSALLGMNDMVSAGILQGLLSAGLKVPEDISLLGFDDTFVTAITTPRLTSVGYDYQAFGAALVQTALEPQTEWPAERRVPVFITERESCAPLKEP